MRALFLTVLVLCLYFTEGETKTCYTLDIRNNVTELEQLENCTIIAGNLQIVLINQSHSFEGYSFPELREITDYLLFYRLYNLYSIGQLFPNLAVIRGQNIFINYALVIYELRDLTEIGLYSLVRISRGSVRIEKNPSLNYAHTINWDVITGGNKQAVIEKQDESYSSSCPSECGKYCWNNNECQRLIDKECHPACLSGCPGRNDNECEVCVNYEEDGRCVMKCNDDRLLAPLLFKCITKEECRALGDEWLIFGKECVTSCPPKYKKQNDTCVFCNLLCPKICEGTEVQDIDTLQKLKGCTNITGALHIRFDTHIKNLEYELEENLGNIEEITGYLKVYRNIQLRNLTFFKNLTMIRGEKVDQDRYSLVVHENPNLQNLWDWENFNMNISNGTFMFHFNPKLCLSEIERLANLTHLKTKFSNIDVSNYTNGDNFACTHIDIEVNEVAVFENNVTLEWRPLSSQDRNLATQFLIYYKEVEDTEPETDEESCGVASWMITFVSRVENDAYSTYQWNITNLKVFTKYEYYVRSDYIKGGRSLLKYFTTKSGDPSVPMNVQTKPIGSDAIKLTWEVPINLNGNLSYYNILGYIQEDNQDFIDDRNYCKVKVKPKKQTYIETTTPAPILNNTCACKKESIINIIQERDFDAICTDLDKHKPRGSHSQGCGTFAYQVIPSNLKLQEEIDKRETSTESSATTTTDKDKIKDLKEDGIYRAFGRQANANETSFIMRQLKHFSIYILFLEACNENETAEPLCSSVVMVSQRTGRKPGADDIQDVTISKETNFIVDIGWYEVNNPNAVIVSYDIEYQNMNLDNSKIITHCITRKEHEKNNFKYRIENLSPGKYRVNVRANSLAGPGNFSAEKTFLITYPPQISTVMWFIIAFIFLFVLGAAIVILYYRYNIRHNLDNMHLIASVNPDYAGYREDEWEIDRENLEIFQELGQGTFGTVYSGTIKNQNVACAIKTVHENATMHDLMEFLNEATVMKSFNEAHHVVRLLGVVSRGTRPLVIMELMVRGDLKSFLRTTRDSSTSLTCSEMYRMAAEIADGMAYLAAKKFVHRDLAARNCMVSADRTVKIGDFGMTRDIYETDYYRKETHGLLPVRWMAPESLADGVFTSDSDVWSYGIVLWEIATLAEQPYQGLANEQVLQFVTAKGILERPLQCPDLLYDIMEVCWLWNPSSRPLFIDIVEKLEKNVGQDFRLVSFYHSREGEDFRMNKTEINKMRLTHNAAMAQGRIAAHWTRDSEEIRFHTEPASRSFNSMHSTSSISHSPPNNYTPYPSISSSAPRYGV